MGKEYITEQLLGQFLLTGSTGFILYWFVVVLAGFRIYYKEIHRIKTRSDELELQLVQAKLSTLKTQLKPHFLFNTLNMTDYLIYKDPFRAGEVIKKLENLLKNTFDREQQDTLKLSTEVANIHKYLEIEKTRFEDRLQVDVDIADETKDLMVPTFILQPLVENSIKYGLNKTVEACTISIRSFFEQDCVVIEVMDNAKKTTRIPSKENWGVGLKNTEKRIKLFFGETAKLKVNLISEGCFRTQILIPKNVI